MANVKISALPTWSGTAADIRYFVMNNSGETETFKFSGYTSPFRSADGADSIVAGYLPTSRATGPYSLVGGQGTTSSVNNNSIVWGKNNRITQDTQFGNAVFGDSNTIGGGSGANLMGGQNGYNGGSYNCQVGEGSSVYGNNNGVFGRANQMSGGRGFMAGNQNTVTNGDGNICMGDQHSMNNTGSDSYDTIVGGRLNRINNAFWSGIFGGYVNGLSGTTSTLSDNIYGAAIVGGSGHCINGNFDFIAGGRNNTTKNNQPTSTAFNSIINGYNNSIGLNGARASNTSQIIGGYGNNIINNGSNTTILGSTTSQTDGAASNMLIINSSNGSMDGSAFSNIISSSACALRSNGYSGIYNSSNSNIPGYSPYYSIIMGSSNSNIGQNYPDGGGNYKGMYNVEDCNVYGTGHHHAIFNGKTNTINSTGAYNTIINGEQNSILGSAFASIVGGFLNQVSGTTNYSGIFQGKSNLNQGNYSVILGGEFNQIKNTATEYSSIVGAYSSTTEGDYSHIFGGVQNEIFSGQAVIVGGRENYIGAGSDNSEMLGCRNSVISGSSVDVAMVNTISSNSNGYDRISMISTSGRTATTNDATFVENLVVFNYSNLNYADDTAAAAGGVVLGQVYHNAGALRIRIV